MTGSLVIAHSGKELAAGTYRGTWPPPADGQVRQHRRIVGAHAAHRRCGSNTAADHIEVLDTAIALSQLGIGASF